MNSRRLKIVLSYDGTKFYGWQIQDEGRTVQGVLEAALSRLITSSRMNIPSKKLTASPAH